MTDILNHFLQNLGWGMLCAVLLIPTRAIARSFFIICGLSIASMWGAALWLHAEGAWSRLEIWPAIATLLLLFALLLAPVRHVAWFRCLLLAATLCAALGTVLRAVAMRGEPLYQSPWFLTLSSFASGWLAGTTMVAMILGHYYLVTPTLSFALLGRFTRLLAILLGLRFTLALLPLLSGDLFQRPEGAHAELFFVDQFAFLLQRGLTLIFLALLMPMIADCVKRRANQSATGLLYVASFLALMGEGVATYFAVAYRLPI